MRTKARDRSRIDPQKVLAVMRSSGVPMPAYELARRLKLANSDDPDFVRVVESLERNGSLIRNRRGALCLVDEMDLMRGRVQGHRDGFGFLIRDDKQPDCFIGAREMQKVLHGDRVVAREIGVDRRGRCEVGIVEIVERANENVVGRLRREHGILLIEPEDKRLHQSFLVAPGADGGATAGQVVVAEIVAQPGHNAQPVARIVEVLGSYADPGMEISQGSPSPSVAYRIPCMSTYVEPRK